jgi:eukaryotic-like serine/threonine-protein kinase
MNAGRLLGERYQVGELLGYGGMAEVHRGRDLRLGRDVAIKMLRPDLARDDNFQLRFRREAQNSASLNHPAIVAVYDTGEERAPGGEPLPYIVMEFVNGRTLKEVLAAEGPLMPRRALEISADICAALEFSHRHGIIHRDVKPGNVMLTQTGQVKVMDFGIARALASGATTMTQTSAVIGTAQYLSPEQARGEAVDARSDVYAAGCVVYELLTGQPPFVGDNPVSVAYQHVREDPRPPSALNPDVPPAVDAVVLKALSKNRMNRYQSAGEMRADLLRAASGRPVVATPVMRDDERVSAYVPPPPRVIGNRNTGTMARVGNAQRRRASTWVLVALSLLGLLAVVALGAGIYLANKTPTSTVPNLSGSSPDNARVLLSQAKLTGSQQPVTSADCARNTVVDQSPKAGQQVAEGTNVTFKVCQGPGDVQIPTGLVGKDKATVNKALLDLGLKPTFQVQDSDKPKDQVLSIQPTEGASVEKNTTVTVTLSAGNQAQVPDLTGLDKAGAQNKLRGQKFNNYVFVNKDTSDPAEVGKVIDQDPQAGSLHKTTDRVTVFIGSGTANTPTSPSPTGSPTQGGG